MDTLSRLDESVLEFEELPGRADIQIGKVLTTQKGHRIRALVTTNNSIILTEVGKPSGDTVILTGEVPNNSVYLKSIWDLLPDAISLIDKVLNGGNGGGSQRCTTHTTVRTGPDGSTTISIETSCGPA